VPGQSREIDVEVDASAPGYKSKTAHCQGKAGDETPCRIALEKAD
jgi:hypothetical protein